MVQGTASSRSLYTTEQVDFADDLLDHAPTWRTLKVFGPVQVRRWKTIARKADAKITLEIWQHDSDWSIIEISLKTEDADEGEAHLRQIAKRYKLSFCSKQSSKTSLAAAYFKQDN